MFPFVAAENLSPVFSFLNLQVIICFLIDYPHIFIVFTLYFLPVVILDFPYYKGIVHCRRLSVGDNFENKRDIDCETIFSNIFEDIVKIDNVIVHFRPVLFYPALPQLSLHLREKGRGNICWEETVFVASMLELGFVLLHRLVKIPNSLGGHCPLSKEDLVESCEDIDVFLQFYETRRSHNYLAEIFGYFLICFCFSVL